MASFKYTSCIKIKGHPILPPIITSHDRVELNRHREDAIRKEEEIATRTQVSEISDFLTDVEVNSEDGSLNGSSTLRTEQVLEFIRQALSEDKLKNLEEVKMLQTAIFEELNRCAEQSALDGDESCDTLHNVEDISPTEGRLTPSFSDISPIKFTPTEHNKKSALSEPHYRLNVPKEKLNCKKAQQDLINRKMSTSENSPLAKNILVTPPKMIRRNSYTLESPSTSVLAYIKSLNKSDQSNNEHSLSSVSLSDKKPLRRLSQKWDQDESSKTENKTPSPSLHLMSDVKNSKRWLMSSDPSLKTRLSTKELDAICQTIKGVNLASRARRTLFENNNVTLEMEEAAIKIQAGIRGYLTRRLMRTYKIIELKNTIKDSLITALQLHSEPPVNQAELELHKRLALQVESVCREWHTVFFELSPQEQMKIIQIDRNRALLTKKTKPVVKKHYASLRSKAMSESLNSLKSPPKN